MEQCNKVSNLVTCHQFGVINIIKVGRRLHCLVFCAME